VVQFFRSRAHILNTEIKMKNSRAIVALLALGLGISGAAYGVPFATNLLNNGDAEAGTGSASGNDIVAVPGWITSGNFTVVRYGAGGGFPSLTDPGPAARGENFFAGGPSNGASSASQSIDVLANSASIDLGGVSFALEGFLGGFSSQRDNAILTLTFKDLLDATIGSASIGPVSDSDRGNATGLLQRSANGVVPVGARKIDILLQMTRVDGSYNDGYADNLSLILRGGATGIPEPGTLALVTLAGLAVFRKAQRRQA
jgi:hypothetical protein